MNNNESLNSISQILEKYDMLRKNNLEMYTHINSTEFRNKNSLETYSAGLKLVEAMNNLCDCTSGFWNSVSEDYLKNNSIEKLANLFDEPNQN